MSLYLGTTLISPNQPNSANQSLGNLNSTGQAKIDGQWNYSTVTLGSSVTAPTTESVSFDLSSYLPDDGYNYEVILTATATSGTTSGNSVAIVFLSDIIVGNVYAGRCVTRTSSYQIASGFAILPVGTGRYVKLGYSTSNTGTITVVARGYRRIGTNS